MGLSAIIALVSMQAAAMHDMEGLCHWLIRGVTASNISWLAKRATYPLIVQLRPHCRCVPVLVPVHSYCYKTMLFCRLAQLTIWHSHERGMLHSASSISGWSISG